MNFQSLDIDCFNRPGALQEISDNTKNLCLYDREKDRFRNILPAMS